MTYSLADMMTAGRTTMRGVRLWDREGLLGTVERNERSERVYTAEHLRRARIIAAAQTAGWNLRRIRAYLSNPTVAEYQSLATALDDTRAFLKQVRNSTLPLDAINQTAFDL